MVISDPKCRTMGFDISELDIENFMRTRCRLSRGTIVTRKSRIRIFCHWLQENNKEISPIAIEEFFSYLQMEKGLIGSSLNTYFHALHTFENYLIERKLAKKFMQGFKIFKEKDPDIIPLSNEEVQLLKKAWIDKQNKNLAHTYKDLVIFLIDTGSRWEDAQNFRCKSVDIIGQQISYTQLKTGSRKIIHLEEPLLSILDGRVKGKNPDILVFRNSHNSRIHYPDFYQYLKALAKSVGIVKRVSPHILRHSYGQNFYDQTGDILLTKDILGHKNIRSTMRYVSNSVKRIKTAQQMHPHLKESVPPIITIEVIEKEINQIGIEKDERFDPLMVKRAINNFIMELTGSIRIS